MINFKQPGDVLTLTAPAAVTGGAPVKVGSLVVVPVDDASASAQFQGYTHGVFELAKTTSQAWTEGAKIYWDDSGKKCTTTASTHVWIGHAVAAAGSDDTTGVVRLHGAPTA